MRPGQFTELFRSNYCKLVFVTSLIGVSFLAPRRLFMRSYAMVGVVFVFITSLLITCLVRNIRHRVYTARTNGASLLGIISIVAGYTAINTCTMGVCQASIGAGVVALVFPNMALGFFSEHGLLLILVSIVAQGIALYFMNCPGRAKSIKKEDKVC